jgi:hypothetical protein
MAASFVTTAVVLLGILLCLVLLAELGGDFKPVVLERFSSSPLSRKTDEFVDPSKTLVLLGIGIPVVVEKKDATTTRLADLRPIEPDASDPNLVPVDGKPNAPRSMFTFAYNHCDMECCKNGTSLGYGCRGGCVCTTEEQRRWLSRRGGNR